MVLQWALHAQYTRLMQQGRARIYALEHDHSEEELRGALNKALPKDLSVIWLVVVAWAAECGFNYRTAFQGFWSEFEDTRATRGFRHPDLETFFDKFVEHFRGVPAPVGRFGAHFSIIRWPLVHAVLPSAVRGRLSQAISRHAHEVRLALQQGEVLSDLLADLEDFDGSEGGVTFRHFVADRELVETAAALLLDEPLPSGDSLSGGASARLSDDLKEARNALGDRHREVSDQNRLQVSLSPLRRGAAWSVQVRLLRHRQFWEDKCGSGAVRRIEISLGGKTLTNGHKLLSDPGGFELLDLALGDQGSLESRQLSVSGSWPPALEDLVQRIKGTSLPTRKFWKLQESIDGTAPQTLEFGGIEEGEACLVWSAKVPPGLGWIRASERLPLWYHGKSPQRLGAPQRREAWCWILGMPPRINDREPMVTTKDRRTILFVQPPSGEMFGLKVCVARGGASIFEALAPAGPRAAVDLGMVEPGLYSIELRRLTPENETLLCPRAWLESQPPPAHEPTAVTVIGDVPSGSSIEDLWLRGLWGIKVSTPVDFNLTLDIQCNQPARGRTTPPTINKTIPVRAPEHDLTDLVEQLKAEPGAANLRRDSAIVRLSARWGGRSFFSLDIEQRIQAALIPIGSHLVLRDYTVEPAPVIEARIWRLPKPWKPYRLRIQSPIDDMALAQWKQTPSTDEAANGWFAPMHTNDPQDWVLPRKDELPDIQTMWRAVARFQTAAPHVADKTASLSRPAQCCVRAAIAGTLFPAGQRVALQWDWVEAQALPARAQEELLRALNKTGNNPEVASAAVTALADLSAQLKCRRRQRTPTEWMQWSNRNFTSTILRTAFDQATDQIQGPRKREWIRAAVWCLVLRPYMSGQLTPEAKADELTMMRQLGQPQIDNQISMGFAICVMAARTMAITAGLHDNWFCEEHASTGMKR